MSKNNNQTQTTGNSLSDDANRLLGLFGDQIQQMRSGAQSLDGLSRYNAHQNPFGKNTAKAYSNQIAKFQEHFWNRWGYKCSDAEIGGLYVPWPRGYCKTLLVMPPAKIIASMEVVCAKWRGEGKFRVWTFADGALNERVPNDRRHSGMYALLHKGGRDADEELRSRSFEQNQTDGIETMRGVEVLHFEDFYFLSTGEHLDPQTGTITSSLDSDGYAVVVYWRGKVEVGQCDVRDAHPVWASRAAVYL